MIEKLNDNLDTPGALALIDASFDRLDRTPLERIHRGGLLQLLEVIDEVLGLALQGATPDIDDEAKRLILERQQARRAKDWQAADDIRTQLSQKGIVLRDTPSGQIWSYRSAQETSSSQASHR